MISQILNSAFFELSIKRRQLSTYVYFAIFLIFAFIITLAAGGAFKGVVVSFGLSNKVIINSPFALNLYISLLNAFGLFIIAPIFGQAIYKDFGAEFEQIIYSTAAKSSSILIGRFIGALLTLIFIFSGIAVGIYLGTLMPTIQQNLIGEQRLLAYIYPYLINVIPNTIIFGSIFYLIISKTKSMAAVYISGIVIFMGWNLSGQLMQDIDNKMLLALVDPFNLNATSNVTEYWSIEDQNSRFVTLTSYILYNRIFWGIIGLISLSLSLFNFSIQKKVSRKKGKETVGNEQSAIQETPQPSYKPLKANFESSSSLNTFLRQFKFEVSQILSSIYFKSICLAGVLYLIIVSFQLGKMFGTTTYPVTYKVLDLIGGSFNLFIIIIIALYAGEAIWREKDNKINQIIDACPVSNLNLILSKTLSLVFIAAFLFFIILISGLLIQVFKGYTHFELSLYLNHLYGLKIFSTIAVILLAISFHVITHNKYISHGLIILYYIAYTWLPSLGFEHELYLYDSSAVPMYSDMNGFGRFLKKFYIYRLYWLSLASLLFITSLLFWPRGANENLRKRFEEAKRRFTSKKLALLSLILVISFISFGSYIFYNTNIRNEYVTTQETEEFKVDYEKRFKSFQDTSELTPIEVKAFVDIFPYQAKMNSKLSIILENKTEEDIKTLFLNFNKDTMYRYSFDRKISQTNKDKVQPVEIITFEKAVKPSEKVKMTFEVSVDRSYFANGAQDRSIVQNGTFFNNFQYFFTIGYQEGKELSEEKTRKKYDLAKKLRMPDLNDKEAWNKRYFGGHTIKFETVVSTAKDQIAIAPGYLKRKWLEKDRAYFHYKMDQPILNFYAFLSARYELKKDKWKDVNIEIYHHPNHEYNLDRMIESTKMSLEYYTQNFSPYQHKQYRILEFPRYESFAQAFPNTIPFSESIGFIAKIDDNNPKDIDYPFYVNAHELGHQWWAHQLIGAGVQGATMLSESFSQYSALMVMKKKYGREKMGKFLKYELDRYLRGRSKENDRELPLYRNENQQYLHYRKGSLVMYALQDYLGEDTVNQVLKEYLKEYPVSKSAPYTTTNDFLKILYAKTLKEDHKLIEDLFEKIVLFHNRALSANYKKLKEE